MLTERVYCSLQNKAEHVDRSRIVIVIWSSDGNTGFGTAPAGSFLCPMLSPKLRTNAERATASERVWSPVWRGRRHFFSVEHGLPWLVSYFHNLKWLKALPPHRRGEIPWYSTVWKWTLLPSSPYSWKTASSRNPSGSVRKAA